MTAPVGVPTDLVEDPFTGTLVEIEQGAAAPLYPPDEWFSQRAADEAVLALQEAGPAKLMRFPAGRVAGVVAPAGVCILNGPPGECWSIPRPSDAGTGELSLEHTMAHGGYTKLASGAVVPSAVIGGGKGHASMFATVSNAQSFYADTSTQLVRGQYRWSDIAGGLVFVGALWPDITDRQVASLLASPASIDYRWIVHEHDYRLIGSCLVNLPGFPAKWKTVATRVASAMIVQPVPMRADSAGWRKWCEENPEECGKGGGPEQVEKVPVREIEPGTVVRTYSFGIDDGSPHPEADREVVSKERSGNRVVLKFKDGTKQNFAPHGKPKVVRRGAYQAAADSTGTMVALQIDAPGLALPGGLAPEELHVTLGYFGDSGVYDDVMKAAAEERLQTAVAQAGRPLLLEVNGVAILGPPDEPMTVLLVQGEGLVELKAAVCGAVEQAGLVYDDTYPVWLPHISIGPTETIPVDAVTGLRGVTIAPPSVVLAFGGSDWRIVELPKVGLPYGDLEVEGSFPDTSVAASVSPSDTEATVICEQCQHALTAAAPPGAGEGGPSTDTSNSGVAELTARMDAMQQQLDALTSIVSESQMASLIPPKMPDFV